MQFLTILIFLFVGNTFAQTLEEKFNSQRIQTVEAPRSEVITEVLQLWQTLQSDCNWYHVGPKNFSKDLNSTPFRPIYNPSVAIFKKDSDEWSFDSWTSLPIDGLPFICIYQNAVWGFDYAREWRGRKFICDNVPTKSVTRPIAVPYVYAKLDDKWSANMKLRSHTDLEYMIEFMTPARILTAQYEINFANKTCFYEYENKVEQCKLVPVNIDRLSSQFFKNLSWRTLEKLKQQCQSN